MEDWLWAVEREQEVHHVLRPKGKRTTFNSPEAITSHQERAFSFRRDSSVKAFGQ